MDKLIVVLPVSVLFLILLWYVGIYRQVRPEGMPWPEPAAPDYPRLATVSPRYSLTRRDAALMLMDGWRGRACPPPSARQWRRR